MTWYGDSSSSLVGTREAHHSFRDGSGKVLAPPWLSMVVDVPLCDNHISQHEVDQIQILVTHYLLEAIT